MKSFLVIAVVLLKLLPRTQGQRTLVSLSKKLKLLNDAEKKRTARSAAMAALKGTSNN
jgi:hypothetical protein